MGEGFIRLRAATFRKKRDKDRMRLTESDLLTVEPGCGPTIAIARLNPGETVTVDETMMAEINGQGVTLVRANREIARLPDPTGDFVDRVRSLNGTAIVTVVRVYPMSGTADVAVCSK
jgi:hypothetical protein